MLVKAVENKNVTKMWKNFTIRVAIIPVGEVWAAVTHLCVNGVWKKYGLVWYLIVEVSC
jgi:hypothetical protein